MLGDAANASKCLWPWTIYYDKQYNQQGKQIETTFRTSMTPSSSECIFHLPSSYPPSLSLSPKTRSPLGGSLVIFTPFCNTCTGKLLAGIEVNHKRKPHSQRILKLNSWTTIWRMHYSRWNHIFLQTGPHIFTKEMYGWKVIWLTNSLRNLTSLPSSFFVDGKGVSTHYATAISEQKKTCQGLKKQIFTFQNQTEIHTFG